MSTELKLIEIKDKKQLNDFVGAQSHAEFLQSWEWGDFQEKAEGKVMRFVIEDKDVIFAAATLVKKSLPLGMNYFYCPRGIIINEELNINNENLYDFFFGEIKKIAAQEKVIFLRFEPRKIDIDSGREKTKDEIRNTIDIQPSKTIMLDLSKSESVLLATMHQKTRYNIRLAEKKGVKIREAENSPLERGGAAAATGCVKVEDFEKLWSLMSATVNRDGFRLHDKEYYRKMLAVENIKLFLGEYEGKPLCAGIFSFFGDTVVYLHGASSNENREVMAPYLLQWELIKRAKSAGCRYYDFSGIDDKKWPGVTRFKHGFSGEEISYPGTFDVIFSKTKYILYQLLRKIRRSFKAI